MAQSWTSQLADDALLGGDARYTSLAMDALGNAHISYTAYADSELRYATNASGAWELVTVDPVRAFDTSIAIDGGGNVHISYYDNGTAKLKYATNASGSWETDEIDLSSIAPYTSLAVEPNGVAHISYATQEGVKYARGGVGAWTLRVVDVDAVSSWSSIALDRDGEAHICYSVPFGELRHKSSADGWTVFDEVDSAGGRDSATAVDASGNVHVVYTDAIHNLRYATNAGGSFQPQVIDAGSSNGHVDIALDAQGAPHISYGDGFPLNVWYVRQVSLGSFAKERVDSGVAAAYTSVALGPGDSVHMSHRDGPGLAFASRSGFDSAETVDDDGDVGLYTSIGVDSQDYVHISYYDQTNGDLKYATNRPRPCSAGVLENGWCKVRVLAGGDDVVGLHTSLAVSRHPATLDRVHISYYDLTNGALRYAYSDNGSDWTFWFGDSGNTGLFTSIALDAEDYVHISYYSQSFDSLEYTTNRPSPCAGGTVTNGWCRVSVDQDGSNSYGLQTSIAVDSAGDVHVSYEDNANDTLMYARKDDSTGNWNTQPVAWFHPGVPAECEESREACDCEANPDRCFSPNSGQRVPSAIAVDSSGDAHISYSYFYDDPHPLPGGLHHATETSPGSWPRQWLVGGWVGSSESNSIALDAQDDIHISYWVGGGTSERTGVGLAYATNLTGSWEFVSADSGGNQVGRFNDIAVDSMGNVHISYYDGFTDALAYATTGSLANIFADGFESGDLSAWSP